MSVYPPPGSGQYQPQPEAGYPGAPYGPSPAASLPGVVADRIAGGLLIPVALLIVAGSFLVQGSSSADFGEDLTFESKFTAWSNSRGAGSDKESTVQFFGGAMVLAGVVALVLAVLLLAGFAARSPRIRALGMFATGLALGVSLVMVLAGLSNRQFGTDDAPYNFGAGFWLTAVAGVLSLAAFGASLVSFNGPRPTPVGVPQFPQQQFAQQPPVGGPQQYPQQQYYPPQQTPGEPFQNYGYPQQPEPPQYQPPGAP